jgi:DNA-binding response OmpR family regulator
VVDDDIDLCDALANELEWNNYQVFQAHSGNTALKIIKAQKIHLVISDVRMPDGDGLSLLDNLQIYDSSIPMILLITSPADATECVCLQRGAVQVLEKPFSGKELLKAAESALNLSSLRNLE